MASGSGTLRYAATLLWKPTLRPRSLVRGARDCRLHGRGGTDGESVRPPASPVGREASRDSRRPCRESLLASKSRGSRGKT